MDREVALEALGVLCNAEVTSIQRPGVGLQAAENSGASVPELMTIHDLVHRVLNGDAFRPVPRVVPARIQSPQGLVKNSYGLRGRRKLAFTVVDRRGNLQLVVDEDEFFDPRFDFDFPNITDCKTFYRGGEVYERPCGWTRFAFKVLGKYDDDTWLGNDERTTRSVAGEWPVSYHGTSLKGAEGIIEGHYEAGDGDAYGRGIYSTPDISETFPYIKTFCSKKTKKLYEVLLQNRINPEYREKYNDDKYWLVKIPKETSEEEEKEMVVRAIRPYSLLLREI